MSTVSRHIFAHRMKRDGINATRQTLWALFLIEWE